MNWYKKANQKIMYIMRGLPGSGKSTKSNMYGQGGVILSTDDFFMRDGEYQFEETLLPEAHEWNKQRAYEAIRNGVSPIVIDNTNTQKWEVYDYVNAAVDAGYDVKFDEADTPWAKDPAELAQRNRHGVPQNKIQEMLDGWEDDFSVESILETQGKQPE